MSDASPPTPSTPSSHLSITPYATPTSAETILARLLPTHAPEYRIPPATRLTPSQRTFLTHGFPTLPASLDPTGTPADHPHNQTRYARKRTQIASILRHLLPLLPQKGHLIDACCGTGHVGLVLAYLVPGFSVTLLDRSTRALQIAERRAAEAGLANVRFVEGDIESCTDDFDALVALHACGGASDACLASVISRSAVGCVIPCCTGGSVTQRGRVTGRAYDAVVSDPHGRGGCLEWGLARSDSFRGILGKCEYEELARCADGIDGNGDIAKGLLEMDRVKWVRECGKECWLGKVGGGVKDDVIVISQGDACDWKRDLVAEGAGQDFFGGRVDSVKRVLMQVVTEKGERFVAGGGRSTRKTVHAAAEALCLRHWSEGKGRDRVVIVARREKENGRNEESGHGEIYYRGYIGATSKKIEELVRNVSMHVPQEYITQKELVRGTEHHITILNARETRTLSQDLIGRTTKSLRGSQITVHGIGRVSRNKGWETEDTSREEAGMEEAYFVVLDWPALQTLRESVGLSRCDAHITLGFRDCDVHDVAKDVRSVVVQHKTSLTF